MNDVTQEYGCDYCGLPVGKATTDAGPVFCCFGCRFAASIAAEASSEGQPHRTLTRLGLAIFFSMNVMVFTLAMWTQDVYSGESLTSDQATKWTELFQYLSLLFSAPVILLLGAPLLENAINDLRCRVWTTDLLIVVGVSAAFLYSLAAVVSGGRHVYFEVACLVLVAVTLGRWLEANGKQRTTDALRKLNKLLPETARVVEWAPCPSFFADEQGVHPTKRVLDSDGERQVPLDQLRTGQLVRVLAGERITIDGVIRRGQAAIDQQLVTGESEAAIKECGDHVFAGTLNLDGDLLIEVLQPSQSGVLRQIMDAVERAAMAKSRWQSRADRITAWFVPAVTLVAAATFVGHASSNGFAAGLMSCLAVLLIACPCALGIATPMAVHAAIGKAASCGVLLRSGDAIERLARIKAICFDKTGTLTTGEPAVERLMTSPDATRDQVVQLASDLASASTHILSQAIKRYASELGLQPSDATSCSIGTTKYFPGRGVAASCGSGADLVYLGSVKFMREVGLEVEPGLVTGIAEAGRRGCPITCVGRRGRVQGVFVFREQLRDGVQQVFQSLRNSGLKVSILSGDCAARTGVLGKSLDVAVATDLLPEDKAVTIRHLRQTVGALAMVGDGLNDAPALAEADVGIAMDCGADVSRDAADVCLLGSTLDRIPWIYELAKLTVRTIRQNLFWAFAYNIAGIALAVAGWLNPIWAAVAMVGSSLFVITNSLRLAAFPDKLERNPAITESDTRVADSADPPDDEVVMEHNIR